MEIKINKLIGDTLSNTPTSSAVRATSGQTPAVELTHIDSAAAESEVLGLAALWTFTFHLLLVLLGKKAAPYEHSGWKLSAEGVLVSTQCLCHGSAYHRPALACAHWRQARNPNKRPFLASARARTRTHAPTHTHRGLSCRLPHVKLRRPRRENDTVSWLVYVYSPDRLTSRRRHLVKQGAHQTSALKFKSSFLNLSSNAVKRIVKRWNNK